MQGKRRKTGDRPRWDSRTSMYPSLVEPLRTKAPLPVASTPTCSPFPVGSPRAAASFVEVSVQPQLPGLLQGPGKRRGPSGPRKGGAGGWAVLLGSQRDYRVVCSGLPGYSLREDQGRVPLQPRAEAGSFLVREEPWWGHLGPRGLRPLVAISLTMASPSCAPLCLFAEPQGPPGAPAAAPPLT